jgi:hypothetical protein
MTDPDQSPGPDDKPQGLDELRAALKRERSRRVEAERQRARVEQAEADMLRTKVDELVWQAALWRAGVRHNPGARLIGPMLDPAVYDDPTAVRAAVGVLTAELLGTPVDATGRTLTEVAANGGTGLTA